MRSWGSVHIHNIKPDESIESISKLLNPMNVYEEDQLVSKKRLHP